jgi:hypothetical protein
MKSDKSLKWELCESISHSGQRDSGMRLSHYQILNFIGLKTIVKIGRILGLKILIIKNGIKKWVFSYFQALKV